MIYKDTPIDVTVLMSTYNGDRFLREQLDSIFSQEKVHVRLIVRDDGSSDRTLDILREYQAAHSDMLIISDGNNMRACASFLYLIRTYTEGSYFALSDQDDVWDTNKLISGIQAIRNEEKRMPNIPILYYSNLRIVNEDNEFSRISHTSPHISNNKYAALIENLATGCTIVYNQKLAKMAQLVKPMEYSMHDVWLYRVASLFGKTIYDFEPRINYRQHTWNVVGASLRRLGLGKIKNELFWIFDRTKNSWYTDIQILYRQFNSVMSEEDRSISLEILESSRNMKTRWCVMTDKRLKSNSIYRNIKFMIKVLFGNE